MIRMITKKRLSGAINSVTKDVLVKMEKAGRYSRERGEAKVCFHFTNNGYSKISNPGYVTIGVDDESNRIYFFSATCADGYKPSIQKSSKVIRITVNKVDEWSRISGEYILKKDIESGAYFIDVDKAPGIF